jgi:hypothetical protein
MWATALAIVNFIFYKFVSDLDLVDISQAASGTSQSIGGPAGGVLGPLRRRMRDGRSQPSLARKSVPVASNG